MCLATMPDLCILPTDIFFVIIAPISHQIVNLRCACTYHIYSGCWQMEITWHIKGIAYQGCYYSPEGQVYYISFLTKYWMLVGTGKYTLASYCHLAIVIFEEIFFVLIVVKAILLLLDFIFTQSWLTFMLRFRSLYVQFLYHISKCWVRV